MANPPLATQTAKDLMHFVTYTENILRAEGPTPHIAKHFGDAVLLFATVLRLAPLSMTLRAFLIAVMENLPVRPECDDSLLGQDFWPKAHWDKAVDAIETFPKDWLLDRDCAAVGFTLEECAKWLYALPDSGQRLPSYRQEEAKAKQAARAKRPRFGIFQDGPQRHQFPYLQSVLLRVLKRARKPVAEHDVAIEIYGDSDKKTWGLLRKLQKDTNDTLALKGLTHLHIKRPSNRWLLLTNQRTRHK